MTEFKDLSESFKTMIINLKVLGNLNPNNKLNTKEKYLTIDEGPSQRIKRYYRGDDRNLTREKINLLIKDLQNFIETIPTVYITLKFDSSEELYDYILTTIKQTKTGLLNLRETYNGDATFVPQLDIEISDLVRIIERLRKKVGEQNKEVVKETIKENVQEIEEVVLEDENIEL